MENYALSIGDRNLYFFGLSDSTVGIAFQLFYNTASN